MRLHAILTDGAILTQPLAGKMFTFWSAIRTNGPPSFLPPLAFMFLQKMARMTQEFPAMVRRAMALRRERELGRSRMEEVERAFMTLYFIFGYCVNPCAM